VDSDSRLSTVTRVAGVVIHRRGRYAGPLMRSFCAATLALSLAWLCVAGVAGQTPIDAPGVALRSHMALVALDRYLETWNSRNGLLWASSLHFPHVRPGAQPFRLTRTAEEYAAGVDFAETQSTGWDHSEWVSREVVHVGLHKVHAAGTWQRYHADGRALAGSAITYIITEQAGRWGVQARFAAGASGLADAAATANGNAALAAVSAFTQAWNAHNATALAGAVHYPHVRVADGLVEMWDTAEAFLAGPEPGRQRTWYETRIDRAKVVQAASNGVNIAVSISRLGRDRRVLTTDEGIMLVTLRNGAWKVQARSTMGS